MLYRAHTPKEKPESAAELEELVMEDYDASVISVQKASSRNLRKSARLWIVKWKAGNKGNDVDLLVEGQW